MKKQIKPILKKTLKGWAAFKNKKRISQFFIDKKEADSYFSFLISR